VLQALKPAELELALATLQELEMRLPSKRSITCPLKRGRFHAVIATTWSAIQN
jgi:hypothetical protein